jgi:hypothetical protein
VFPRRVYYYRYARHSIDFVSCRLCLISTPADSLHCSLIVFKRDKQYINVHAQCALYARACVELIVVPTAAYSPTQVYILYRSRANVYFIITYNIITTV